MKRYLIIAFLISGLFIYNSCEKFEIGKNVNTFFHVKIKNTELPVWIKGNTDSDKFIIYINGGPGITSIDVAQTDMFSWSRILENKFAMVYYDQRGCGNAQGNIIEDDLTVNQYVEDLETIITVVKSQYENSEIFLMAHSFGAFIGAKYLMDSTRQSHIDAWITVDGAFNFDYDLQWKYRREFLKNLASEEITGGRDVLLWTEALNWVENTPVINTDDEKEQWREYLGAPGQKIIPLEEGILTLSQYLTIGFSSSYNPFPAYLSKNLEIVNNKLKEDVEGENIISEVSEIKIPSLFIWGRYDDLIPIELGFDVFNYLGSSPSDKKFVTMNESSHKPFISDPDKFQNSILEFIQGN